MNKKTLTVYEALEMMRRFTKDNIPFSIEYVTCNITDSQTKGVKQVSNVLLRTGLSSEASTKHASLIGYTEAITNEHRWFYLPLLLKINNIDVL